MRRSAKSTLVEAKRHIDAVEKAQSPKDVIKLYQKAKNILANVDVKKEDGPTLKDRVDAFLQLADILNNKGLAAQDKAEKCRQRAAALKLELNRINSVAATVTMSLLGVPQIAVSVANYSGAPKTPLGFSKKADRESFVYHLPAPGERLESTRQLAYCLALLQKSFDVTCLDPGTLEWRCNTLKNPDEMIRMETTSRQVVTEFIEDREKDAPDVEEVVQLAQVLHEATLRSLLESLVDTVSKSILMHFSAMEGLARVIDCSIAGSINSNDLVTILDVLNTRLQTVHKPSASHLCRLLHAASRVLDAMVAAQVGDVNRITLHGPLTARLHELESHQDRYVAFQAEYATQALLNVSDNDTVWQAGLRRGWMVLKGAAGFAKMPDPRETKDMLGGLETIYKAGKGSVQILNNTWVAIKSGEKPTFTAKEGLKFKWIWYPTLRSAEGYLWIGDLAGFKELVASAPCRHQLTFQMGVCQLLGRFVVDTQWDLDSRRSTLAFLNALHQANDVWNSQKGIEQVIYDMFSVLVFNLETRSEVANVLQNMMQQQHLVLAPLTDPQSHPWFSFLSINQIHHGTPTSSLLMAVQNKKGKEESLTAILCNVQHITEQLRPSQSNPEDIMSALESYHSQNIKILRISGDELEIGTCFVNLAIVEAPAQREREKQKFKEQAAIFHRIPSSESVRGSNIESSIRLEQLFDKRKLRDGKEGIPKRVLVQGRAGIGKSTLCKKIVHLHQSGLWADRFEAVLWLPLRRLRGSTCRTLESLLREKVFTSQLDREHEELSRTLAIRANHGKVLFVLDGLDEITTDAQSEDSPIKVLLRDLLDHKQVVITSRPSGLNASLLRSIDLELETIGFSQQDVKEFICRVLEPGPARTVHDFIQRTPLIQGLVNIPVQLDVICFCWESLPEDGSQITITRLYQLMTRKLWCKDALRLKKGRRGQSLTEKQINRLTPKDIDRLMSTESRHLGYLVFKGLRNKHQIEFDEAAILDAFEDLADSDIINDNSPYSAEVLDMVKETSFLHSIDATLETGKKHSQQTWSFLHLTFQEYFAATWVSSEMTAAGNDGESCGF
ncbi:hypothetical protein EC968_003755 [Mortierella alpina]|nr:hypothetical protein EC968_003755 [Mortierella alpina]